jgi:hypothetical protein
MVDGIYHTWTSGKSITESILRRLSAIRTASGTRAGSTAAGSGVTPSGR